MEKSNKNFLNFFLFREKSWAGPWAMGKLRPKVHQVSNTWPKEEIVHMATVLLCAADGRKITCGRRFNALFFRFPLDVLVRRENATRMQGHELFRSKWKESKWKALFFSFFLCWHCWWMLARGKVMSGASNSLWLEFCENVETLSEMSNSTFYLNYVEWKSLNLNVGFVIRSNVILSQFIQLI